MGRIRTIKPELLEDSKAARLSDRAWRLFVSCFLLADDQGNFPCDNNRVSSSVFWGIGNPDISGEMAELEKAGMLKRYIVRDQQFASIVNWGKHQKVDKPGKPHCPGPEFAEPSRDSGDTLARPSRITQPTENTEFATLSRDPRDTLAPDLYQYPDLRPGPGPGPGPGAEQGTATTTPRWQTGQPIESMHQFEIAAQHLAAHLGSRDIGAARAVLGAGPILPHELAESLPKAKSVSHLLGIIRGKRKDAAEAAEMPVAKPTKPPSSEIRPIYHQELTFTDGKISHRDGVPVPVEPQPSEEEIQAEVAKLPPELRAHTEKILAISKARREAKKAAS